MYIITQEIYNKYLKSAYLWYTTRNKNYKKEVVEIIKLTVVNYLTKKYKLKISLNEENYFVGSITLYLLQNIVLFLDCSDLVEFNELAEELIEKFIKKAKVSEKKERKNRAPKKMIY